MKRYFPFLRGKQYEMMALRELAEEIAESSSVIPLIEPVRDNPATRISLDRFIEVGMPFLLITTPFKGLFTGNSQQLFTNLIEPSLMESDTWIPAIQLQRQSTAQEISAFLERYENFEVAVVYMGLPDRSAARTLLGDERFAHHVFVNGTVDAAYVNTIPQDRRVMIFDRFQKQERNADYPERELFTDWNTVAGNPQRLDFGDFSMVGDNYSDEGGPAYAVALHHIHFQEEVGPLDISHFISDRTETTADTPGKTLEALTKLVEALDELEPSDTGACDEYREIEAEGNFRGLGYMKKLALKHHLEVMINGGIQL